MEVILAKHYGFCPGVKRVVHILKTLLEKHDKVFTYGQLIHNNQFIDKMKSNGMVIASSLEDIPRKSCVLTRAHGIIKSDKEILEHMDVDYVDGTCPFVDAVHIKANQLAQEGYQVILVGDKNHPEVVSALSYMDNPIIIEGPDELNNLELTNKVGVVSQTTQAKQNIDDVKRRLEELFGSLLKKSLNLKLQENMTKKRSFHGKSTKNVLSLVLLVVVLRRSMEGKDLVFLKQ